MGPKHFSTFSAGHEPSRNRFSSSACSDPGNAKTLDVGDVPTQLLEIQYLAQQIQQRTADAEIVELARQIEEMLNPCISAMAAAAEQLAEVA